MNLLKCIILVLFVTVSAAQIADAHAETVLRIHQDDTHRPAGRYLEYLEDRDKRLTAEEVSSPAYRGRFVQSSVDTLNFGFSESAYWIRLTVAADPGGAPDWLLQIDYPLIDFITLYERNGDTFFARTSGDMVPFGARELPHRNFLFPLHLPQGPAQTLLLRVETASSSKIGIELWRPATFFVRDQNSLIGIGMFYGILIVMAVYNLFLFFTVRDRSYLLYVFYVVSFILARSSLDGLAFQYLWPRSPWWGNASVPFFASFSCLMVVIFSVNFLGTKRSMPRMHRVLLAFMLGYAIICLISLVCSYSVSIRIFGAGLMSGAVVLLFAGYRLLSGGYGPARFYVLSWTFMLLGSAIYDLNKFGVLPSVFLTETAQHIGSLFEVVLLSFALGDRITLERREKLEAQQAAVDNLHKADRLKDEFLANTSHELRTPLNGIIGIAESLIDGATGPLPEPARVNLEMIVASGRRLASLVNDILDFSKMRHKELLLDLRPVDLRQIVEIVLMLSRPLISAKNVLLENRIPPSFPPVEGDENRLMQIMHNLVGNAIKFTESGTVTVSGSVLDGMVEVSVADTGIGIPADRLDDVFSSFEQVDATAARRYGGTGLGLAITKDLVELHRGAIRVSSVLGGGSTFTVSLPIARSGAVVPAAAAPAPARSVLVSTIQDASHGGALPEGPPMPASLGGLGGMEGVRVLAVDDEPVNLQVLRNNLSLAGILVETAASASEALDRLAAGSDPDIILLDIMMPRMNGYELCRIIRESRNLAELPIVFLTARNQVNDLVEGFVYGANDYIPKPFTRNELLARIKNLVALKRAIRDREELLAYEHDLSVARNIQRSIVPEMLPELPGVEVQVKYFPIKAVGGDFFDFHVIDDTRMGILIADVSGHGVSASMIAAMLKIAFSMEREHADDPARLLEGIRLTLVDKLSRHFLTASYVYLDLERHVMRTARAGHLSTLVMRAGDAGVAEITPRGLVVSNAWHSTFEMRELTIAPGDRIVLFTDGITELRNGARELYGEERFFTLLSGCRALSAYDLSNRVISDIAAWSGKSDGFDDDLTLIIVDIVENRSGGK